MNERIQQLYIQAITDTRHDPADDINLQIANKFSELIVQECIAQCEKNAEHSYLGPGSKLSAFNIKEHFGVEL